MHSKAKASGRTDWTGSYYRKLVSQLQIQDLQACSHFTHSNATKVSLSCLQSISVTSLWCLSHPEVAGTVLMQLTHLKIIIWQSVSKASLMTTHM